jgi:phosphoribosylglycinamide formyltransferase 2
MVTLISQDLSEFALHVRAFLGLPVGAIRQYGPAASAVILPQLTSQNVTFSNIQGAVGRDCSCVCSASRRLTVPVVWA